MANSSLYEAVEENDVGKAMELLQNGADVNSRGGVRNLSVLTKACITGNCKMVALLLANNASVNTSESITTALLSAARENHTDIVELLLQKKVDVNQTDKFNSAAIHWAAKADNGDMVGRLIQCGAAVDFADLSGKTPLCYAAKHGSVTCVAILLANHANPHHKSDEGSPLDLAKSKGHHEIVRMIEYAVHTEFQQWYDQNRKQECEAQQPSDLKMLHSPTKSRSKSTKVLAEGEQLLQNLREEIEKLKQERDMAQEALISANNQIEQLEMQLAATLANKSDIEKERDDDHTLRKDLENILAEERQRRKDAEDERDQLRQLLSLSEKSMDELRQHLRERSEEELSIPSCDLRLTNVKLGGGSYGEVRIAYWKECPVAVKMLYEVLTTSKHNIDLLMQEASVAWKIHHPNVASVCGVTLEMESKQTKAWIIMELLQASMTAVINESLRSESQALTLREKVDMAHDSLSGLNYLHSLPRVVYHGDIRPTNILVTRIMTAKLGDLGAARFSDVSLTVGLVSPPYAAPERMDGRSGKKSKETDIYSMGVSICELFTGLQPIRKDRRDQVDEISDKEVRDLCMRMVSDDSRERPSAAEALTVVGHLRECKDYKACPPRRMVKGKLDGAKEVTFADRMW